MYCIFRALWNRQSLICRQQSYCCDCVVFGDILRYWWSIKEGFGSGQLWKRREQGRQTFRSLEDGKKTNIWVPQVTCKDRKMPHKEPGEKQQFILMHASWPFLTLCIFSPLLCCRHGKVDQLGPATSCDMWSWLSSNINCFAVITGSCSVTCLCPWSKQYMSFFQTILNHLMCPLKGKITLNQRSCWIDFIALILPYMNKALLKVLKKLSMTFGMHLTFSCCLKKPFSAHCFREWESRKLTDNCFPTLICCLFGGQRLSLRDFPSGAEK